jgi:hypothetical protein
MARKSSATRLNVLLWLVGGFPLVVSAVTELNSHVLVWHFRLVDFVDLVVLAPFYLILMLAVHRMVMRTARGLLPWIALGLVGLFLYGHAMHLTANAINTYSTEVHDYIGIIPADTYELIYFLDEDLGHWLLYAGLFGLLGTWTVSSDVRGRSLSAALAGAVAGLALALSVIESSHAWIGFAAAAWLVLCVLWKLRSAGGLWAARWRSDPLLAFATLVGVFLVVGELAYLLVMGSFAEPSELRGGLQALPW